MITTNNGKRIIIKLKADIIVVGAGAAGLLTSHFCAQKGHKVILLEHNKQAGRKILISGGGRCNFTNIHSGPTDFQSNNTHFAKSALSRYSPYDFIDLVEQHKIKYFEKKLGQLFCKNSAKEIVAMLMGLLEKQHVEVLFNIKNLKVRKEAEFEVYNDSVSVTAPHLIVATGGLSLPSIGASDWGHQVAKQFGHKIIPAGPALVPFKLKQFSELSGTSVIGKISVNNFVVEEDILFTHKGLSGPAILKASLYWRPGDKISINWLPQLDFAQIDRGKLKVLNFLKKHLPQKFAAFVLDQANISDTLTTADLSKGQWDKLEKICQCMELFPEGTEGFRKAEVTRGGVDTSEISSKTLESQLESGLYFIGEVLDVTGQLGGHNFQWAWASAYAAAEALSKE